MRETIVSFYKKFETYLAVLLKFAVGLVVFSRIGGIGLYMPIFEPINSAPMQLPYILLMAMLFTVMTMTVGYGLIIINICIQTSAALGVMTFAGIAMLLILFFYARLAPKENFLILATFFAFEFGVPYLVPLLAGLYLGLTSVIPISIGVMIVSFTPFVGFLLEDAQLMSEFMGANIAAMPEYFGDLYMAIFADITGNQAWVFTAFIFSMVVFIVYTVSRFTIDHAKEIALGAGIVVTLLSTIIAELLAPANVSMLAVIVSVVLSGVLAFLAAFFDMVLDYQRTERVQFEDETNFYQVKITPKIVMSRKQRVLKRINPVDEHNGYLENNYPTRPERPARAEPPPPVRPTRTEPPKRTDRAEPPAHTERLDRLERHDRAERESALSRFYNEVSNPESDTGAVPTPPPEPPPDPRKPGGKRRGSPNPAGKDSSGKKR